jgi:UDP-N-acetylmuramoylalanine-D-glutamate ligase
MSAKASPALPDHRPRPPLPAGPYLVAGLGRAGRAAAVRLHGLGAAVRACESQLTRRTVVAAATLRERGMAVALGGDGRDQLESEPLARCLVKSPGIAFDAPVVVGARERGIAIVDELEVGWRLREEPVVAITGTNGKSTVAALIQAVLEAAGFAAPLAGNTTFGPPLSGLDAQPVDAVVCEVSSFQLEGCPAFLPEAAVLTNIGHDHLYRHRSASAYADAKRRMLVRGDRAPALAVVCADDPGVRRIGAEARDRGARVLDFGFSGGAAWHVRSCESTLDGSEIRLQGPAGSVELATQLPGRHNALNVAATLALAGGLGIDRVTAAEAIASARRASGRLERVAAPAPFDVVVDFAHNPDGVHAALTTLREVVSQRPGARVIGVLGMPDINDATMNRVQGEVASRLADELVLTTDRWGPDARRSPPAELVAGARGGRAEISIVPERRDAIGAALGAAGAGDVVAVLGRGDRAGLYDLSGRAVSATDVELVWELIGSAGG